MKKKLRDLTYGESAEFCAKREKCKGCPLIIDFDRIIICIAGYYPREIPEKELDKEIEI